MEGEMKTVLAHRSAARLWALAATLIAVGAAVLHPSTADAMHNAPNETDTFKVKPAGVSLSVPNHWVKADLTKESLDQIADTIADQNPDRAEQIREFSALVDQGAKFFAFELTTGNGVNVLVGPGAGADFPVTLHSFRESYEAEALNDGDALLNAQRVKVGGRTAFRTLVSTSVISPAGEHVVQLVGQLVVRRGDDLVIVTVGTADDETGRHTISDVLGSVQPLGQKSSGPEKSQV
jgi:hypothetical protein